MREQDLLNALCALLRSLKCHFPVDLIAYNWYKPLINSDDENQRDMAEINIIVECFIISNILQDGVESAETFADCIYNSYCQQKDGNNWLCIWEDACVLYFG